MTLISRWLYCRLTTKQGSTVIRIEELVTLHGKVNCDIAKSNTLTIAFRVFQDTDVAVISRGQYDSGDITKWVRTDRSVWGSS